ncbi:Site-specific recombinase XerD [Alteribacillus persepolensis]|uniref:Site-specific recombinase XerD n=1 Tax=Alteribacillus persepolensis TaxID=568899 RepID=A0A1G7YVX3_9BACI|nr:tyrosine-type recombinase/integrase [Alteribacillus persepolensis]SDH00663.1 Site-specific recombinase XerD [Alteribacillus persepolensis]
MEERSWHIPFEAEAFLNHLTARQRKESTIKRYRYDLADFYRFIEVKEELGEKQDGAITPQMIEEYFYLLQEERHYQLRTLKRVQTVLKRFFHYLQSTGYINVNPMTALHVDDSVWNTLTEEELITHSEEKQLKDSLFYDSGMSHKQAASRPLLAPRNLLLISLFLHYGFRLQEISLLRMKHVNQGLGELSIPEQTGNPRVVTLTKDDKNLLYHYVQVIPKAVRPVYPEDPLFVAFDFQRQTYRWSYETDAPKNLTEIAIQKMVREERKRAGIDRAISARHFRNTFIVRTLQAGTTPEKLQEMLGLNTILTLNKYIDYVEKNK